MEYVVITAWAMLMGKSHTQLTREFSMPTQQQEQQDMEMEVDVEEIF